MFRVLYIFLRLRTKILGQSSGSDVQPILDNLTQYLGFLLSNVFLFGMGWIICGHIWGFILNLEVDPSSHDYFQIVIPPVIRTKITGKQMMAGFTAYAIALFVVAAWLHDFAKHTFIDNVPFTDKPLTATQLMAVFVALVCSIIFAGSKALKGSFDQARQLAEMKRAQVLEEQQRIALLTEHKSGRRH